MVTSLDVYCCVCVCVCVCVCMSLCDIKYRYLLSHDILIHHNMSKYSLFVKISVCVFMRLKVVSCALHRILLAVCRLSSLTFKPLSIL